MGTSEVSLESVSAKGTDLGELDPLIAQMYDYMKLQGLLLPLAPDGGAKLRRAIASSLGRTGLLVLARSQTELVGFAHGVLRLVPDYLGGGVVGFVGHTFVSERFRALGLGAQMFEVLEHWFIERGAASVELQVLTGNAPAIGFWERCGFTRELLQMRKFLPHHRK